MIAGRAERRSEAGGLEGGQSPAFEGAPAAGEVSAELMPWKKDGAAEKGALVAGLRGYSVFPAFRCGLVDGRSKYRFLGDLGPFLTVYRLLSAPPS